MPTHATTTTRPVEEGLQETQSVARTRRPQPAREEESQAGDEGDQRPLKGPRRPRQAMRRHQRQESAVLALPHLQIALHGR